MSYVERSLADPGYENLAVTIVWQNADAETAAARDELELLVLQATRALAHTGATVNQASFESERKLLEIASQDASLPASVALSKQTT